MWVMETASCRNNQLDDSPLSNCISSYISLSSNGVILQPVKCRVVAVSFCRKSQISTEDLAWTACSRQIDQRHQQLRSDTAESLAIGISACTPELTHDVLA